MPIQEGNYLILLSNISFKLKKYSKGVARFLAKLCLNSLYGMFGRKLDVDEAVVVNTDSLYGR